MKKIVIDARIINSSTGRYIERLLTYLEDVDDENQYIVLVPSKDKDYWKPTSSRFTVQTSDYKNYSFGEQFGFARQLYSLKADLVHFCMPQQPLFYFKPHVTTVHDLTLLKTYNSDKNWLLYHTKQFVGRIVFWWIGRTSRHIITPSLFTKNEYARFASISPKKITVTYEAADTPTYPPKKISLPFSQFILYVGQQSDYKNIRKLITSHQILLKRNPKLGLILVGNKNKLVKRNETWVEEKEFQNIYFTGFVDDQELSWLYQNCQAYVFPSLMEGFGLPGLEAMVQGAPVVSSDATCLPEVYGNAAHYFNPQSEADMAEKIEEVITDTSLKQQLIAEGSKRVQRYSWQKTAAQTYKVYLDALGRK